MSARSFLMAAVLAGMAGAASGADDWARTQGSEQPVGGVTPPGAECHAAVEIDSGLSVVACRQKGADGIGVWSRDTRHSPPVLKREALLPGASRVRFAWHRAAACTAAGPCATAGILLVDAFDDYCMGTTVLQMDGTGKWRTAGRIPEIIEKDGEPACIGSIATVRGPADSAVLAVDAELQRQTPAGEYRVVKPAVVYGVQRGVLTRSRRP